MNSNELESIFKNWNPEKDKISIIKSALDEYGSFEDIVEDPILIEAIYHVKISEDFEEEIDDLPPEKQFNILTCDFNGNCLIINGNTTEVKHISDFYR